MTPAPVENESQSTTTYSNYIQNVADSNVSENEVLEVWTPERWQVDKKTGKMQKVTLLNKDSSQKSKASSQEPTEVESIIPIASTGISLLTVEEEDDEEEQNDNDPNGRF